MSPAVATETSPRPRSALTAFTTAWASQIGITVAFLALWLAFIVLAPRTFLSDRIYLAFAQTLLVFFVAAQAPELLVRDQRHRVLTLYFSRALERADYVLAKYFALVAAIGLVLGLPQVILLLGMLFGTPSLSDGLAKVLPLLVPVAGRTVVIAALMAGIGLVASAFTVRRAFAAATIIGAFLVMNGVVTVLVNRVGLHGPLALIGLADPFALMDGVSALLLGVDPTMPAILRTHLPVELFAVTAVGVALACLGLLVLRYRRITA